VVAKQGHAHHRHAVVHGLVDAVQSAVAQEGPRVGVACRGQQRETVAYAWSATGAGYCVSLMKACVDWWVLNRGWIGCWDMWEGFYSALRNVGEILLAVLRWPSIQSSSHYPIGLGCVGEIILGVGRYSIGGWFMWEQFNWVLGCFGRDSIQYSKFCVELLLCIQLERCY
jgi:hypothetical protein